MDPCHLIEFIRSTLRELDLSADQVSDNGLRMVLGTACQESECGRWIHQLGDGPARGIYQMEPDTADDIVTNYLNFHQNLKDKVFRYKITDNWDELEWNLKLSTMMCRVHYYRVSEALPTYLAGQANYWKKYYNTFLGAGDIMDYMRAWNRFIVPGML
jgi:hypothetical protein